MGWKCCVPSCKTSSKDKITFRKFPIQNIEIFKLWIERISNPSLINKVPVDIHKKFRICDLHFSIFCKLPGEKWIKKDSLPTLFLPGFRGESTEETSLHRYFGSVVGKSVEREVILRNGNVDIDIDTTSSSYIDPPMQVEVIPLTSRIISTPKSRKGVLRKRNILRDLDISRSAQLTPKAMKLYKKVKYLRVIKRRLNSSVYSLKDQLKLAHKVAEQNAFENLSPIAREFLIGQLGHCTKNPKGRRFSTNEKVVALSIFKSGSRGYKLLQSMGFCLPSRKTLLNMLRTVRFRPGINLHIFDNLEKTVRKMHIDDRNCMLLFDEMSIQPAWTYDEKLDEFIGLEDYGEEKCLKFADHCQVFMLRGIRRKWKQPVAYAFSEHSMGRGVLAKLIKDIVTKCYEIGLRVIGTVCDQGQTNVSTINDLIQQTKKTYLRQNEEYKSIGFEVNGKEIIPLFDPPHLLKGLRNNLLTKDCTFTKCRKTYTAKWQHFIDLYNLDNVDEDLKMCSKLSDIHLKVDKMPKMKVSIAAQVLSQRVAAFFNFAIKFELLPEECKGSYEFASVIDKLFDSVNGHSAFINHGKKMRVALSETSPHLDFWKEVIPILKSMKFNKTNGKSFVPPTITNWIRTIEGLQVLWQKLSRSFKYLNLRNINQDPLENFFAGIRSQGLRNVNPTPQQFINSFLTLVINNFLRPKAPGANCEDDESEGALNNLRDFVTTNYSPPSNPSQMNYERIIKNINIYVPTNNFLQINVHHYVAGFSARDICRKTKHCLNCKKFLLSKSDEGLRNSLINARAYTPNILCTPTSKFAEIFQKIYFYCKEILPQVIVSRNIKEHICNIINLLLEPLVVCNEHNLLEMMLNSVVKFYLYNYCKNINSILKGKRNSKFNDKIKYLALKKSKQWSKIK